VEYVVDLGDGAHVGVAELGDPDGVPVLWCHGGPGSRLDAASGHLGAVAAGVRLIALDRPGIGLSSRRPVETVAQWAMSAGETLDRIGVGRFAVAGWSAGGAYALACGAELGERVSAIATVSGMIPVAPNHDRAIGSILDRVLIPLSERQPRGAAIMLLGLYAIPDAMVRWSLIASAGRRDGRALADQRAADVARFVREAWRSGPVGVVDDYRRFGGAWGFDLSAVRPHVTVWQGEEDTVVFPTHGRELAAALPDASLRVVDGAGHFLFHICAEEILRDLIASAAGV
jgi:pimeloyl-ACP methyl ester carboxylesterase